VRSGGGGGEDALRGSRQETVDDRREIDVESHPSTGFSREPPGFPRDAPLRRSPEGDRGAEQIPQSIERPAFLIQAKERAARQSRDLTRQIPELLDRRNVAPEENDGPGRTALQDATLVGRQESPADADAEEPGRQHFSNE